MAWLVTVARHRDQIRTLRLVSSIGAVPATVLAVLQRKVPQRTSVRTPSRLSAGIAGLPGLGCLPGILR